MPSPNAIFNELTATTFRNHGSEMVDNVSNHNALYRRMKKGGNTRVESGGLTITEPLEYAMNGTYQRYSGFDVLNVSQSDVVSAVEFPWRQIAINVVASGLEMRTNSGKDRIINLVKSRITNAMHTFANNFSFDMYSDGSLTNQIAGLQALVSDAGTGTIGGIDAATWAFWRNLVQSAAAPMQGGAAITPGPTTIESLMLPLYIALTRGNDAPDLIVASDDYYAFFEQSQTSLKRYSDADMAQAGFLTLKYKKADVVFDGNSGMPASRMYFLNTRYIKLVVHRDANLTVLEDAKPFNQDASVTPVLWMGNQIITNRRLQGVLKP